MDSYYAMLKVTRDSKFPDDVTKSYRKLALRAHPDKGGSKEAFDALHRAYEVLKDEEKRKVYDRFGFDFGDDESADELLGELSPMAMRLIGIAIFRAALCGAVVVGLRYRVPRTLCIAACGGCVVYGRTRSDKDFEFLGYRAVFVPLVAWLASYMGLTFVFDVVVYAITFGALEWESLGVKGAALGAALIGRWWFGASLWLFVKVLLGFGVLLIVAHLFFVVVASVVKEVVDLKLAAYGDKFRKCMKEGQSAPAKTEEAPPPPTPPKSSPRQPTRKNSMNAGFLNNPKKKNR